MTMTPEDAARVKRMAETCVSALDALQPLFGPMYSLSFFARKRDSNTAEGHFFVSRDSPAEVAVVLEQIQDSALAAEMAPAPQGKPS